MGFEQVVELALYHPTFGFYETGGSAGRSGDFLTSPEVGPLFGAVLARALDAWWSELGQPAPFTVVEAGAGRGALAKAVLAAEPACRPALRYVAV
ncbi:MAG TPA: SAM-dependent methyltransferase, partial [Acidimicrobiales bacterium]|nr:SAM-dependent methyltransferase [Acidimicrobiales bacterium]